jgi:hypothetical protein
MAGAGRVLKGEKMCQPKQQIERKEPVFIEGTQKWNSDNDIGAACAGMEAVLMALWNKKERVIQALFSGATEGYLDEWRRRTPERFWCNLDLDNRARVMRLALGWYGTEKQKEATR